MEISKADGKSCRWLFQLIYENSTIPLSPKFPVSIPETVLFSDKSPELGLPVKWMRSDEDGNIERLEFPIEARNASEKLKHVERSFENNARADEEWFCRAFPVSPYDYKIGSEKAIDVNGIKPNILDRFRFKKRVSSRKWRKETSILQAYNAQRGKVVLGTYKRGVSSSSSKADKLVKRIALFINKASVGSRQCVRVKVVELVAQFAVDRTTGTEKLNVERPRGARPNVAEVSVAMIHLRGELRKLMIQAERRGMSYKELWHHFGPQGKGDGFVNRHDLVKGFRILGFDEMKSDDEEDDSMESGSVWMHLLGEIETNGRGNLSFSQFVKFVERLKRPERPTFKKETKKVEEEEEKGREKKKNKRENTSSSLQRVRVHARNEEMMGERKKKKKKKKKSSLLGDDTRESLKRSLLELQERVERNMFSSTFKSTSSKTIMPRITTPTKIKTNEEKEEEEPILPPPSNAHMYSNDEITRYYRIIIHKEIITEEEIKESSASSRMIAVAQSRVLRGLVKSKKRFSLIVLPDFFDTIDTMTEFANPLAKTIPECPILVLSQPRTNSKKVVLSNDVISNQFNMLLRHAESNSQIFYPCLALGFGNGGNVLMSHLISKRNDNRRLVRAAMVVNSFAYVDKPLRQNLTQLLKMPRIASHQERMMFLGALLFSDEFLRDETCRDKLRKFFRGRKIFSEKNNSELCHSIARAVRDALFHHQDLRPRLKDLRCPLLIVAASQDAFVLSKHSEEISSSIERVADTVPDCVTQQASTMMWFQGGHGLLQERTSAISSTVQRLAKEFLAYDYDENLVERKMMMAKGDVVRKSFSEEWEEVGEEDDDEEVDDEYKNDNNKKKNKIKGNEWRNEIVSQGSYQRTFSRDSQHVEDQSDLRVREIESENRSRESERVSVLKKQKRERARQRNERARELEHHRKEIEETAQKLRDDQALKTEKEMEKEENRAMAYEERMTRSALRYEKSILEYTKNQKEAQWISEQLCSLRGEGIDRRKDLEKGMIVAEKRETRRQMKEKQRKYLAQNQFALADIELKGEKMGYGIDTEFLLQGKREEVKKKRTGDYDTKYVKLVLEGSRRLRSDFDLILNHREKALGAQRPVHEKMIRYMDSQTRMRKSLRIREKAIRQAREDLKRNQKVLNSLRNSKRGVDKNRSIVLTERNARLEKEMERLDSQIEECNQDLADLAAKLRINKEEVDTVDRGVQQVILVQKRLVRVLDAMKVELLRLYSEATHRRTNLRHLLDNVEIRMDEVHEESEKDRKREEVLLRELERIRPLKVRFVDTTVWQENVPQRIRLKKLKTFLKKEARKLRRMLEAFEKETKELETREHELHDGLKMTNHDIGDIQVELEDLERTFLMVGVKRQKSGEKKPKEDRVREGESLKERADRKKKREKISQMEESEKEKRALAKKRRERYSIVYKSKQSSIKTENEIRNTPAGRRNLEERLWTALDMQLNPNLYKNITDEDKEAYKFDNAYKANISQLATRRIYGLQPRLNEALAYLFSEEEIKAYLLLNKFRGESEDIHKMEDARSMVDFEDAMSRRIREANEIREARTKDLTDDERDFVRYDMILRPHLYGEDVSDDNTSNNETFILWEILKQPRGRVTSLHKRYYRGKKNIKVPRSRAEILRFRDLMYKYAPPGDDEQDDVEDEEKVATLVLPDLEEVPQGVLRGPCVVDRGLDHVILQTKEQLMEMRETRRHEFHIPKHSVHACREVEIVISIKGVFEARGYILGRLAAQLFYVTESGDRVETGFAPARLAKVCTSTSFGRLVLVHRPAYLPVPSGRYEVVIMARSRTKYNVTVSAKLVDTVPNAIRRAVRNTAFASQISQCQSEIKDLQESVRLGQRKLLVARSLLNNAKERCSKLEAERFELQIVLNDEEKMSLLTESERHARETRVIHLEREFIEIVRRIESRSKEMDSIRVGISDMVRLRDNHVAELYRLCKQMMKMWSTIPPAVASYCCVDLPQLIGKTTDSALIRALSIPAWAKAALGHTYRYWYTPAMCVRLRTPDLWTSEEHRWRQLDFILRPEMNQDLSEKELLAVSTDAPSYSQFELKRILSCPISDLTREERDVRRLLQRYHYNLPQAKRGVLATQRLGRAMKLRAEKIMMARESSKTKATEKLGSSLATIDVDARCRMLLQEVDRAMHCKKDDMDSYVLHETWQRFPTSHVRSELVRDLDHYLAQQVLEAERFLHGAKSREEEEKEEEEKKQKSKEMTMKGETTTATSPKREAKSNNKADRRKLQAQELIEKEMKELGLPRGACMGCRKPICQWREYLDEAAFVKRLDVVSHEIEIVTASEEEYVHSDVPSSVLHGGTNRFYRPDLIMELRSDEVRTRDQIRLNRVDKELHSAFCVATDMFESHALHGYPQMLKRQDAVDALQIEQHRLVGKTVALEIVDYVLEWMLEGWMFGERESNMENLGYVPSIQKDKKISTFQAFVMKENKVVKEEMLKRQPKMSEKQKSQRQEYKTKRGHVNDRWKPIQVDVEESTIVRKALRIGSDTEHLVNETERTIKFGLFSLTLMFFRSMKMLKKEKDVWTPGNELTIRKKKKPVSKERKMMMQEERNRSRRERLLEGAFLRAKIGTQRKRNREAQAAQVARRELRIKAQHAAKEVEAATKIAALFRGHKARKFAKRWARALAEDEAKKALETSSAIVLQSTWRMYVARCIVHERRQELLHFLEKMKAEEAKLLEEEYWRVNVLARYKRALRNKLQSSKTKKKRDQEASEMNREAIPRWYRHEMPSAAPKDDGEGGDEDDSEYEYYGEDYDGEDDFSDISSGEDEG